MEVTLWVVGEDVKMKAVELESKWDNLSPSIRAVIITLGCNDEKAWEDCDSIIELTTQIQVLHETINRQQMQLQTEKKKEVLHSKESSNSGIAPSKKDQGADSRPAAIFADVHCYTLPACLSLLIHCILHNAINTSIQNTIYNVGIPFWLRHVGNWDIVSNRYEPTQLIALFFLLGILLAMTFGRLTGGLYDYYDRGEEYQERLDNITQDRWHRRCWDGRIMNWFSGDELRNKYEKTKPRGTDTLHNEEQQNSNNSNNNTTTSNNNNNSKVKHNKRYHWGSRLKPIIDVTVFYVCLFGVDFFCTEWVYKTILNRRESILEELPSRRLHQQWTTRQQQQTTTTTMQNSFETSREDNICIQTGSGSDDIPSLVVDICINFTNINKMHFESEVWNWATNDNRCGWMEDEWKHQINKLDDEYLRDNISFENYYSFFGDPYRHFIDTARETQFQMMVVILGATGLYWLDVPFQGI